MEERLGKEGFSAVYTIFDRSPNQTRKSSSVSSLSDSKDFSMSIMHSNVPPEMEVVLRPLISNRVTSSGYVPGYSAVYREHVTQGTSNATSNDAQAENQEIAMYLINFTQGGYLVRKNKQEESEVGPERKTTVVLAILHKELDLLQGFQQEIDIFCRSLEEDLLKSCGALPEFPAELGEKLNSWPEEAVHFLPRAITALQDCLESFLFAILCGKRPTYVLSDKWAGLEKDVRKFAELCGTDDMVKSPTPDSRPLIVFEDAQDNGESYFSLSPNLDTDCGLLCSDKESTVFTQEWAQVLKKLVEASASAASVKEVHFAFKHKVLKDMNAFQRMLGAAENDHYSLYRTVQFLRRTQNESLLINWTKKQFVGDQTNHEMLELLDLLENYLKSSQKSCEV